MQGIEEKVKEFLGDESGQVSAELLIVTAAVIAVAVLLITQLQKTGKEGSQVLADESDKAISGVKKIN